MKKKNEFQFEPVQRNKKQRTMEPSDVLQNYIHQIKNVKEYNVYEIDPNIQWDDLVRFRQTSDCKEFNIIIDKFEGILKKKFPVGFWDNKVCHKICIFVLRILLGFYSIQNFYKLTKKELKKNHSTTMLAKYNNSPYQLLKSLFPEHNWLFWKFGHAPSGLWKRKENQVQYMNWLSEKLGYTTKEDWYKIAQKDFSNNYGSRLLNGHYNGSPYQLLSSMFPEHNWLFWKFGQAPQNSWKNKENQLKYMIWLGKQLGYIALSDWYKITLQDFIENHGGGFVSGYYNGSPYQLLISVFPDHNWLFWKFGQAPQNQWDIKENQLKYITWLGNQLGYMSIDDWYQITQNDFHTNYGGGLLHQFNDSPYQLLMSMFPDHHWLFWKFTSAPNNSWDSKENQLKYMNWLGEQLGNTSMDDWYNITCECFKRYYGGGILSIYKASSYQLLTSVFPEYNWLFWKFGKAPQNQWDIKENQLKYMSWLGEQLGYTTMDDWYKIQLQDFVDNYGGGFISSYYNGSPYQLLISIFPDHNWLFWKFGQAPHNQWDIKENQVKYITWLGKQLGYTTMDDWYKIQFQDFVDNHGGGLMNHYNSSPYQLLKSMYPEYEWLFWKFTSAPNNSWVSKENQLKYMTWLAEKLGYTTMDDWYKIKFQDFVDNHGGGLMNHYNSSPYKVIIHVYSDYDWLFWKFKNLKLQFWDDKANHDKFMNWLGEHLGYTTMDDWYKITADKIEKNFGGWLKNKYYNGSPFQLLKSVYPEHKWLFWKFVCSPKNSWKSKENQLQYMNWLGEQLGYTSLDDWYKITGDNFIENHGGGFINYYYNGSPYQLVSSLYPNYEWDRSKFRKLYSKQQIDWLNFLQKYYNVNIEHACNVGEYQIPNTMYHADGFCRDTTTIYEFHGDYWHGNPRIFPTEMFNKTRKCTYGELYQKTLKKEERIRSLGYKLIVIWEFDWKRINHGIRKFQILFKRHKNKKYI